MKSDDALLLLASVLSQDGPRAAATAFAAELRALTRVDEVAVGLDADGHASVLAMTHQTDFRAEADLVQKFAAAMDEAIVQGTTLIYPTDSAAIVQAHADLVRHYGAFAFTVPMVSHGQLFGAVTFLRRSPEPLEKSEIAFCENVISLAGPLLQLKREASLAWAARLRRALRAATAAALAPGHWRAKAALAATAILFAALALLPVDYRISAPARLEGVVQAALVAPADGFLQQAHVRPGDPVVRNQVLAELNPEEMLLERRKWESALAQHENAAPAALARADRGQFVISQAQADEARAQIELIDTQLARSRLLAPFDGLVIQGDLTQLLGAPVERGEVLMTIAPANEYRLMIEVDDRDIATVQPGQRGRVALGALTSQVLPFTVERVTPVSTARDGRNFFEVVAGVDPVPGALQPGLQGVALIQAGQRPLLWIWSHRAIDWLRLTLWSWGWRG